MKKQQKIIELLRSGDFTIAYHDNGSCMLYKGKHEYKDLPKREIDIQSEFCADGYEVPEVVALVEALGGSVVSI